MKAISMLIILLLCSTASALPQIFNTNVTITLNNNTINIAGEQNSYTDSIGNFTKTYQLQIIRDSNDTDVGKLIQGISDTTSYLNRYVDCSSNLSLCMSNYGYRDNFTTCQVTLSQEKTNHQTDLSTSQATVTSKQSELDKVNSQKWLYGVGGAVAAFLILQILGKGFKRAPKREDETGRNYPERDKVGIN